MHTLLRIRGIVAKPKASLTRVLAGFNSESGRKRGTFFFRSFYDFDMGNDHSMPDTSKYPYQLSDKEWKAKLTPLEYRVLRQGGTEAYGAGEYCQFFPKTGYFAWCVT